MKRTPVAFIMLAASTLISIAAHEGWRGDAYIPVKGDVPTIGFGFTKDVKMGDKIDPVQGIQRLYHEVDSVYARIVRKHVTVPLSDGEFSALVQWVYNLGEGNLRTSAMLRYFNSGEYGKGCGQMVRWVYGPNKVVYPGLQKRRVAEYLECVSEHQ